MIKNKHSKKDKPIILVVNDDGVIAPGINHLVEAVKDLGRVVVVAPDKPQSGMGHAITIGYPLRLHKTQIPADVEAWSCSGTPVDCVKLAVDKVLHRKPDICLSGINHGANHSINVISECKHSKRRCCTDQRSESLQAGVCKVSGGLQREKRPDWEKILLVDG